MSRVALANIPALTFYKGDKTASRRNRPVTQLVCIGQPCKIYTPEVVRCENLGGSGTDIDWRCEADLPEALRFGRVEVGCEGWKGPGDPYVLKGSCNLEYRLVQIPGTLRSESSNRGFEKWAYEQATSFDPAKVVFMTIWVAFLAFILYSVLKSCLRGSSTPRAASSGPSRPGPSGWFPGDSWHRNDDYRPPPPYSKDTPGSEGWRPGFWSGAAAGALGSTLFNNSRRRNAPPDTRSYDWEQSRRSPFTSSSSARPSSFQNDDRGEGPSNLGAMRSSTGLGGSNVR